MYVLLCLLMLFVIQYNYYNFGYDKTRFYVKRKSFEKIGKGESTISKNLSSAVCDLQKAMNHWWVMHRFLVFFFVCHRFV